VSGLVPATQLKEQDESVSAARSAGLTYVTDGSPGIRRLRAGSGFRYLYPDGHPVRDKEVLGRIGSLVIPPAWRSVWICPLERGHLQATGRDDRGRKQYRYHPRYRARRELKKYEGLVEFGEALPAIRKQVQHDLSQPGLPRDRVVAAIVDLLDLTSMRIGNDEYARDNHSYGLTTLRNRHASVRGTKICLRFKGKSGKVHSLELDDRRLAFVVKRCHDLPGYELFQYVDESGDLHPIDSSMVNDYLRTISGRDITAKDFRTWHGTVKAAIHLAGCPIGVSKREVTNSLTAAVKAVSEHLGNRPATCRKYYIHPAILDAYSSGGLEQVMALKAKARRSLLAAEEHCVLLFLTKLRTNKSIVHLNRNGRSESRVA
jgi:DNA topoisomerase-1